MKKYQLDLNDLEVVSFDTVQDVPSRIGTVFGHATEFTNCSCDYGQCTGNYYTCDAQCTGDQTRDDNNTCNLQCGGGGGGETGMNTAAIACYTNLNTCTMIPPDCNFTWESCLSCPC